MRRTFGIALLLWVAQAAAQRLPCDLVPEETLPNCHFTTRSNYALHGLVRSNRVVKKELAPDPRKHAGDRVPRLWIQEPAVWLVFSPAGEILETAGSLAPDGTPIGVTRRTTRSDGSMTEVAYTTGDPRTTVRRLDRYDEKGRVVEQRSYTGDGKLINHSVQEYDPGGRGTENCIYDGQNKLISRSLERYDAEGRMVEAIDIQESFYSDMVDTYDRTLGGDDTELTSRAWYDENGELIRQISLRDGVVTWWWQRPDCGRVCQERHHSVGFNYGFDRATDFEIQPDGSLSTILEHHKGRYGNIENDDIELVDEHGNMREKIAYRYRRDVHGNWVERVTSILDPASGAMVDIRLDTRDLTYY